MRRHQERDDGAQVLTVGSSQAGLPRRWWPLLVSLAVHTLLIVLWVRHGDRRPVASEAPEARTMFLVPLRPMPAPQPPQTAPDKRRKEERPATRSAAALAPAAAQAVTAAPAPQQIAPSEIRSEAPANPATGQILEDSRQAMGQIGRDLRAQDAVSPFRTKPAPPVLKPSGKWARFAQQVEDAHREPASAIVTEEYTQPDGRTLYRIRRGNKVLCRQSGFVEPVNDLRSPGAILAGAGSKSTLDMQNSAGEVLCPESDRDWIKR